MNGLAIYFSGTGNTKYILDLMKHDLHIHNHTLELSTIEDQPIFSNQYDFYVFGAPIHGEFFPAIYLDWIKSNVPQVAEKPCLIITTLAANNTPTGLGHIGRILQKKGFHIVSQQRFTMPNNWPSILFAIPSKAHIAELRLQAKPSVAELVDYFTQNIERIDTPNPFMYYSIRPFRKLVTLYIDRWAQKKITVDHSECIKCDLCAKICPVDNLALVEDHISFSGHCIACMRCVHTCPVNAFVVKGKQIQQILAKPFPASRSAMEDSDS